MNKTVEYLTWLQVRDFLNTCTDEQLNETAEVGSDDSIIRITKIEPAEEDYYIDPENTEEGIFKENEISEDELEFHEIHVNKGDIMCEGIDIGYL